MGKVTAYEALDGSLHKSMADQIRRDDELRFKAQIETMAGTLDNHAPYVDDWNASAFSGTEDMKTVIELLINVHPEELRNALDIKRTLDAPQVATVPQPKKVAKKVDARQRR